MKITMTQNLGDEYEDKIFIEDATLTEALVLLDAFFNDGQRVDEAQKSVGEKDSVWNGAPEWATHYGKTPMSTPVWYDCEKYKYYDDEEVLHFGEDWYDSPESFIEIASREV